MTIIIGLELAAHLGGVYARRNVAIEIERIEARFADGTVPAPSCCHANVDRWVAENVGCYAVRGWLISGVCGDAIHLDAHSVVCTPDSRLIDITLKPDDQRAPFIPHLGDDAEFKVRGYLNQTWWPLPSY